MRIIKAQQGQNLFDIAIQTMGSAMGALLIAGENDLSVTAELSPGQELWIPERILDMAVIQDLRKNGIRPASTINEFGSAAETFYAVPEYVEINYWL